MTRMLTRLVLFFFLSSAPPTVRIIHSGHACNVEEERHTERVYTIREGETLELTCLVTGHPRPQVRNLGPCRPPVTDGAGANSLARGIVGQDANFTASPSRLLLLSSLTLSSFSFNSILASLSGTPRTPALNRLKSLIP